MRCDEEPSTPPTRRSVRRASRRYHASFLSCGRRKRNQLPMCPLRNHRAHRPTRQPQARAMYETSDAPLHGSITLQKTTCFGVRDTTLSPRTNARPASARAYRAPSEA
jgi:hypothetical protein